MQWLMRVMAWRSKQPAITRWLQVFLLYGIALAARLVLGKMYGGIPSLAFYPMLLVVAVVFGWKEALVVLVLSVIAGVELFMPIGMYLLPVGWFLVGGLTIAIIGGLRSLTEQLADANERQRLLFRELQHRVANTLQSTVSILNNAKRRIDAAPGDAKAILDDGMRRILASADAHRRLNDPTLFEQGLGSILQDAVAAVIDTRSINVSFDVQSLRLGFEQMSIVTMLVIEFANNAQKHVFEHNLGKNFAVSLRASPEGHAVLVAKDDGPPWSNTGTADTDRTLGQTLLRGLAEQLRGTVAIDTGAGTEITVIFPIQSNDKSVSLHGPMARPIRNTA